MTIHFYELDSLGSPIEACKLISPLLLLSIILRVPRSPPLVTQSPFTYTNTDDYRQTTLEASSTLASIITFNWAGVVMKRVTQQAEENARESSVPYLQSKNRGYHLYHEWKASCQDSLNSRQPANALQAALGCAPNWANGVAWRISQTHKRAYLRVWFFDTVLIVSKVGPAWALKRFLQELSDVEIHGSTKYAWAWLVVMIGSLFARTFLTAADYFQWYAHLHTRVRSQMSTLVFEKILLVRTLSCPKS